MKNITCVIVALNEEQNILDCIESIRSVGDFDIKVYDGGSTDQTVAVARKAGVSVCEAPGTSLSHRRQLGADESDKEFVFYVDADHRIGILKSAMDKVIDKYFNDKAIAGIMFRKRSDLMDYWSEGFLYRNELFLNTVEDLKVIGMPCMFRNELVKSVRFHEFATGSIDDTLLCTRLIERGFRFKIADEYVIEKFRASFRLTVKKAFWYGLGDAEFVKISEFKLKKRHFFHVLVRNMLIHPAVSLIKKPFTFPFFVVFGVSRASGFLKGMIKTTDMSSLRS